jgi:hypothetical protein
MSAEWNVVFGVTLVPDMPSFAHLHNNERAAELQPYVLTDTGYIDVEGRQVDVKGGGSEQVQRLCVVAEQCDPSVLRVVVMVYPNPNSLTLVAAAVQVHTAHFNKCMHAIYKFRGFYVFLKLLSDSTAQLMDMDPQRLHWGGMHMEQLDGSQAVQPAASVWQVSLQPHQLESLLWMQSLEARVRAGQNYLKMPLWCRIANSDYLFNAHTHHRIVHESVCRHREYEQQLERVYFYGGILADPTGSGKTAVVLALVAAEARRTSCLDALLNRQLQQSHGYGESAQVSYSTAVAITAKYVSTTASLIVVPLNLGKQWLQEVHKFVHAGQLKVIKLFNKRDLFATSMRAMQEADVVLTSMHFLTGPFYSKHMRDVHSTSTYYGDLGRAGALEDHMPVLVEVFFYRRVIYDEQHEVMGRHVRGAVLQTLTQLRGEVQWGITATPDIHASRSNNYVFNLPMHVADSTHMQRTILPVLLHEAYRRTVHMPVAVRITQHEHITPINDRERSLLHAYRHSGLERLVQVATCFNVLALFGDSSEREDDAFTTMSFSELARVLTEQQSKEIARLTREVQPLRDSIAFLLGVCTQGVAAAGVDTGEASSSTAADTDSSSSEPSSLRTMRRQLKTEQRRLERREAEIQQLQSQMHFFTAQLSSDNNSCPICFDADAHVVTKCGHWFCRECVVEYKRHSGGNQCPVCKAQLHSEDWVIVSSDSSKEAGEGGEGSRQTQASPDECDVQWYGSKLAAIVRLLRSVVARGERAVMFVQWTSLMRVVRAMLNSGNIVAVALAGNANMMAAAQHKFVTGQAHVLLLSLEWCTSGLNLVHANHVIFAHALVAFEPERHRRLVQQAVARVKRYGQTKDVHVHWFISGDTDEERLYRTQPVVPC